LGALALCEDVVHPPHFLPEVLTPAAAAAAAVPFLLDKQLHLHQAQETPRRTLTTLHGTL